MTRRTKTSAALAALLVAVTWSAGTTTATAASDPRSSPAPTASATAPPSAPPTERPEPESPGTAAAESSTGPGDAGYLSTADPSLDEMTAAGDHTMGSTVRELDPTVAAPSGSDGATAQRRSTAEAQAPEATGSTSRVAAATPPGIPGLDVSAWQENVDWAAVYNQGARFAYVKATEGLTYKSSRFASQYGGAYDVGMIRGAYHFAVPNRSSATAQADYFVANGGGWAGDSRTLPPLLDIEYNPYAASDGTDVCYGLSQGAMVSWIAEFSQRIQSLTGARPAIYTTTDWWTRCTGNNAGFSLNPLFVARYPANLASGAGTLPSGWSAYTMWQYSSTGPFPGDSDVFNGTMAGLQQLALTGVPLTRSVVGNGDLNGDGRPDLVARKPDGTLWFYATDGPKGAGVGFASGTRIGTGWGVFNQIVLTGDLNGDDKDDIVARRSDGTLWLYPGTGASPTTGAGLGKGIQIGSGWSIFTDVIAAGDTDGDGRTDLVARKSDGTLWLYAGTGRAGSGQETFRAGTQIGSGWNAFAQVVGVGDMDGDGRDDLVAKRATGALALYRGQGTSYVGGDALPNAGMSASDLLVAGGDADQDGRVDLFTKTQTGALNFFAGTSVQLDAFGGGQRVGTGWDTFRLVIGAGDVTADGSADVVAIGRDGRLWSYPGKGNGGGTNRGYSAGSVIGSGWEGFQTVAAADLTGDGKSDLIGKRTDGSVWIYPGTGTGSRVSYGAPTRVTGIDGAAIRQLRVAELTGDSRADLLVTLNDGGNVVLPGLQRAAGSTVWFGSSVTVPVLNRGQHTPVSTGDRTGDGRADVLATKPDGSLVAFRGTGSSSGAARVADSPLTVGSGWTTFPVVGGTGDTVAGRGGDVLAVRNDGTLWYYPATGRTGTAKSGLAAYAVVGSGWNVFD
ncbi:GH25 family lysozyme [Frigoribacterium sp. PhB24]|uniref:GH25 family lysozyme n=1 Tax=Frigoribacterium sp. PhB24 TaxID=2485204 RepID=UPI0011CEC0A3|nr:GH25 family lysozyme [Frigoribacterium sp. PhB24]